jgi:hypothetical protein
LVTCWDLDNGTDLDDNGDNYDDCDIVGPTLDYTWTKPGTHAAYFHVEDDDGERTSQRINFTVRNRDPIADIWGSTTTPKAGEMFGLSGNLSTDTLTDQPDLIYQWDLDTSVDSDDDGFAANDIDESGMEIWVKFDETGEHIIRLTITDNNGAQSTKDYTVLVAEGDGGLFSFLEGGGGTVTSIVVILGLILASLLGILAWTSIRGGDEGDPWDQVAPMGMEAEQEAPMSAPPSDMFAAPAAEPVAVAPAPTPVESSGPPPIPAEGLPPGWTEEQWSYYGAQWLAQQAPAQPEPAPAPTPENPFSTPSSAEDDLDLDF